jgi:hypothetical protein
MPDGIRLLTPSQALADSHPCLVHDRDGVFAFTGGLTAEFVSLGDLGRPCEGYFYMALSSYESESGVWKNYDEGNGRNGLRFAVCQFPARYCESARYTFIANERYVVYLKDTHGIPPSGFPRDPEAEG